MKYFVRIKNLTGIFSAIAVAFVLYVLATVFNFSYLEIISRNILERHLQHVEYYIIFSFLFLIGLSIDLYRLKIKMRENAAKERLKSFKATMRTVQDMINNSLNSLQILRLEAEESGALNEESLLLFDSIIKSTAKKLTLLSNLENIVLTKNANDVETLNYQAET